MFGQIEEVSDPKKEKDGETSHQSTPFSGLKELTKKAIENPEEAPNNYSIIELSPEVHYKVMTKSRTRLLEAIKHNEDISSIKELARAVDRRPDSVSRDLKILENYGFIKLKRNGKQKVPKLLNSRMIVNF